MTFGSLCGALTALKINPLTKNIKNEVLIFYQYKINYTPVWINHDDDDYFLFLYLILYSLLLYSFVLLILREIKIKYFLGS